MKNFWLSRNRQRYHVWHRHHVEQMLDTCTNWIDRWEQVARLYVRGLITKEQATELLDAHMED